MTKPEKPTRGRPPETLVIPGDWQDAVKDALKKGKPPTPTKRSTTKKRRPKSDR